MPVKVLSPRSGGWLSSRQRRGIKNAVAAYGFILPALIGVFIFRLYPIALSMVKSLFQTSFVRGTTFVGLENYRLLMDDPVFWQSLKVTLLLNLAINPIQIIISLAIALLVNRQGRVVQIYRTIIMLPMGVSLAIACTLWRIMLDPNDGLVNSILNAIGIASQPFLTSPSQALWSIILIASWKGIAYWMMFFLSGLQEIPDELYEASTIDGASRNQQIWYITLPLLRRVALFVTVAVTSANFLMFVPMFMLTLGGPNMSTNTLMYEAYTSGFVYFDEARGMAITSVILLILLIVVLLEFRLLKED